MKKILTFILTLGILAAATYGISNMLHQPFIDFAFLIGILGMIVIRFFNSAGGYTSKSMDMSIQGRTGIKMEQNDRKFEPNIAFYTAMAYTILTGIVTFIHYKDYFFN
ncbi:hypothetical protein HNQ94_003826 [Salirhabdus euzebyi]|uniref:DUF3899 domain-containing protein n=1 Tax=Salirhabdus euzebyi TaxID=394506 RepID=A0A841QAA1_9BACI|nr:hypothetical protein [Salirhabdus euzebyi]MBB6455326.1 hypothetical protein [Salirhabdus euzebyi]